MSPNIKQVARLAGVSVGTVSNVLNRPDRVSPATRDKVMAAIDQLGFVLNESARQLRAGQSRSIGLVVLDVRNPFFTEVARGVEDAANAAGHAVILCNSDESDEKEQRYLRLLQEQRVRGILITPVHTDSSVLQDIRRRGTPVVLLDRRGPREQCSVAVDDVRGGMLAVQHLIGLGHRQLAMVNGPLTMQQCAERRRGARRAAREAGLDLARGLLEVNVAPMNATSGAAAFAQLMQHEPRPTAVFCTNDLLALGVMREAMGAGLRVPQDLPIVGYDDIEFAADSVVPLSSVRQPKYEIGRTAAELMLEEADHTDTHKHRRVVFRPELVIRESTTGTVSPAAGHR